MLGRHAGRLLELVPADRPVRVVDLGPGSARPTVGLLRHLLLVTVRVDTGVDRSWYVVETGFDPDRSEIFVRARFAEPVTVTFDGPRRTVSFAPGSTVLLWRYLYLDGPAVTRQLNRGGLEVRLFESREAAEAVLVAAMLKR